MSKPIKAVSSTASNTSVREERALQAFIESAAQADPLPDMPAPRRCKVYRDNDRPLEFDGFELASEVDLSHRGLVATRAALYRTKGGKFIGEFTRFETQAVQWDASAKVPLLFAKGAVFDSQAAAMAWFRPGRFTNSLLDQLGELASEFIE
jgi:hypothetical protein